MAMYVDWEISEERRANAENRLYALSQLIHESWKSEEFLFGKKPTHKFGEFSIKRCPRVTPPKDDQTNFPTERIQIPTLHMYSHTIDYEIQLGQITSIPNIILLYLAANVGQSVNKDQLHDIFQIPRRTNKKRGKSIDSYLFVTNRCKTSIAEHIKSSETYALERTDNTLGLYLVDPDAPPKNYCLSYEYQA